ncbi:hypothetical protein QNH98_14620 [Myroides sp. mNGS23_01]|nr:hypothetical protein [Myroides sp. mNGS23_01]WHT38267.1 hypothetical protein QNH98_14620 [Myroides sp. mNGS23_01]
MYKRLLPIALLFSSAIYSQTAKDTLWVNAYDETTTKALASSFRVSKPFKQKRDMKKLQPTTKKQKQLKSKESVVLIPIKRFLMMGKLPTIMQMDRLISICFLKKEMQ